MNKIDLYQKTHRMISQRARRNPNCPIFLEIKALSSEIYERGTSHQEQLAIARKIILLENSFSPALARYGSIIENALLSKNYMAERPFQIRHRFQDQEKSGIIYILNSTNRPGECKLGATTLSINKRCELYESKYGYSVYPYFFTTARAPFSVEFRISEIIRSQKVISKTNGDSIEWYMITPERLKGIIIDFIRNRQ